MKEIGGESQVKSSQNGAKSFFVQSQIQNLVGWLGSPFTLPCALKTLHFILAKVCSSVFFVV